MLDNYSKFDKSFTPSPMASPQKSRQTYQSPALTPFSSPSKQRQTIQPASMKQDMTTSPNNENSQVDVDDFRVF